MTTESKDFQASASTNPSYDNVRDNLELRVVEDFGELASFIIYD